MAQYMWPFILLQFTAVVAIVLFLRMLLHKQLEIGMTRIKKLDQGNVKKELNLNEGLENLDKEWNKRIGEAEAKALSIVDAAKEESRAMREEERLKAKDEAKKIISGAIQQQEKLLKKIEHRVFDKALTLSQNILNNIFSEDDLKDFKTRISNEVINVLSTSKDVKELIGKNDDLEVITVDVLGEKDRNNIIEIFTRLYGKKGIKFSVDKTILGGLILKAGGEIVDGSIVYRINKAAAGFREKGS